MKDLIERRAAIKAVDDLPNCYNGYSDTYDKSCIIGVLEELPSAQPEPSQVARDIATIIENEKDMRVILQQPQWIPCGERLPKEDGQYLITEKGIFGDYLYVSIANYGVPCMPMNKGKGRGWFITDSEGDYYCDMNYVLAWMPLIEPYKERREE